MTPASFIAKWSRVTLPERAASQEHFIDLCRLLGQPTPAEHDATGTEYTFEKGVAVTGGASKGAKGDSGFADVWWRAKFGWEYKRKGKYKDLSEAYRQLLQYREALDNPPLLVVCDITRTQIHTNFTGTAKQVHEILLQDFDKPESLSMLRRVFTDPASFCPAVTVDKVTEEVAKQIARLALSLHNRGHDPHTAAHFLMKVMFCLFAEDVSLLPNKLFSRLLGQWHDNSQQLTAVLTDLFAKMASGGAFGVDRIPWFNGGLFDASPALELTYDEIGLLLIAAGQDWGSVEPAIFGTLFERSLDPDKRAQIGAHYTSRDDILLIVEPVVMAPLRREWDGIKAQVEQQLERRRTGKTPATKKKADQAIGDLLVGFLDRLSKVRILDPACGSANFLYVTIQELLNLEKEVITFAARPDIGLGLFPTVRPTQLHGIEINPYAAELAQVVIWIGYLQWMRDNGFNTPHDPILEPLKTIENRDAILDLSDPNRPAPAKWPEADFIIGNPPFLGSKLFRKNGLSDEYVQAMFNAYDLPKTSDLCCYWFELARRAIEKNPHVRAGLLATQGIRGSDNRTVLERIKKTGDIFMAWSDRDWILDGAAVHVSMIGFDNAAQSEKALNGGAAETINADLTSDVDAGSATILPENANITFMGTTKGGAFEVEALDARRILAQPNPNGKSNFDVIKPWFNGKDLTQRTRAMWIIDFGCETGEAESSAYEGPFEWARIHVFPERSKIRQTAEAKTWWLHNRSRPDMRAAIGPLTRFVVTTRVAKHRLFRWAAGPTLPDSATFAFARSDDYFFGVLHSSIHELWALRMGTQLEDRPRYTPTTCFETFPLPWPPGKEPMKGAVAAAFAATQADVAANAAATAPLEGGGCDAALDSHSDGGTAKKGTGTIFANSNDRENGASPHFRAAELHRAIAQAAAELNEMRERWLNPPEWIDPIAKAIDARDDFHDVPAEARALIRQSAIMAAAAADPNLKKRTLTNLYNERPTWLKLAHKKLDQAVLAAYAEIDPEGGWSTDWADVWFDTGAGQPLPADHPQSARRAETDQKVLANLLRLNGTRNA